MDDGSRNLTFVEEQDVETQVFDWGMLHWLSEPRVTTAERFSVAIVELKPGKTHEEHDHLEAEEILYVLSGKGKQSIDVVGQRIEREIGPGVLIHIPPAVSHSTVNTGEETLRLLSVCAPPGQEACLREESGVLIEPPERTVWLEVDAEGPTNADDAQ